MNDYYPNQDVKRYSSLTSFMVNSACSELGVLDNALDAAETSSNARLSNYAVRPAAQNSLGMARAISQGQTLAPKKNLCAATRQIKDTLNMPAGVLESATSDDAPSAYILAPAPQLSAPVELSSYPLRRIENLRSNRVGSRHRHRQHYAMCMGED